MSRTWLLRLFRFWLVVCLPLSLYCVVQARDNQHFSDTSKYGYHIAALEEAAWYQNAALVVFFAPVLGVGALSTARWVWQGRP